MDRLTGVLNNRHAERVKDLLLIMMKLLFGHVSASFVGLSLLLSESSIFHFFAKSSDKDIKQVKTCDKASFFAQRETKKRNTFFGPCCAAGSRCDMKKLSC